MKMTKEQILHMKHVHSGNLFRFFSANATVTSLPLTVTNYFTVVMEEGTHVHTLTHALMV